MATETRYEAQYSIDYQGYDPAHPELGDALPAEFLLVEELQPQKKRKDGQWVRDASCAPVRKVLAIIGREQLAEIIASGAEKLATVGNYTVER